MPSARVRSSIVEEDLPVVRKIRSRHSWKLENINLVKGQSISRKSVQQVQDEMVKRKEKSHFSKHDIESLCRIFRYLTKNNNRNTIDRTRFQDILHNTFEMTDVTLMDRVFKAFDRDNDGQVDMLEWVAGLNIYLRGTFEEKIAFAFDCYSLRGEKYITRQEMFHLLRTSIPKANDEDPTESIKELVEITLKKMDKDRDNRLSDHDFTVSVREDPLLLSCFGRLYPNSRCKVDFEQLAFASTFTRNQLEASFDY